MGTLAAVAIVMLSGLQGEAEGTRAGDERTIGGVKLCWCPPGRFTMGSPPGEPGRRPDEAQAEVTLTRGYWAGKYEVTQGEWRRVVGTLPGEPTAELPEGEEKLIMAPPPAVAALYISSAAVSITRGGVRHRHEGPPGPRFTPHGGCP